jgi:hypothetical protein
MRSALGRARARNGLGNGISIANFNQTPQRAAEVPRKSLRDRVAVLKFEWYMFEPVVLDLELVGQTQRWRPEGRHLCLER